MIHAHDDFEFALGKPDAPEARRIGSILGELGAVAALRARMMAARGNSGSRPQSRAAAALRCGIA